jgi:hypothetical protein
MQVEQLQGKDLVHIASSAFNTIFLTGVENFLIPE